MYFDRFDVEAHFAFYADHYSGQFSDFYIRLCESVIILTLAHFSLVTIAYLLMVRLFTIT